MVKYIVQRGDTLGNIASKYETTVAAIVRANGIRNPDMIHKGQILRIPTKHYDDGHKNPGHSYDYHDHKYEHHYES